MLCALSQYLETKNLQVANYFGLSNKVPKSIENVDEEEQIDGDGLNKSRPSSPKDNDFCDSLSENPGNDHQNVLRNPSGCSGNTERPQSPKHENEKSSKRHLSLPISLPSLPSFPISLPNLRSEEGPPKISRRHLPLPHGPHSVGCVDLMCDLSDKGTFFRLYYPTAKVDLNERYKQWPLWLPRKQYAHGYVIFLKRNKKIFNRIFNWLGGDVHVPVLWQAPLLRSNEQYPIVIVSHGIGGNRTTLSTYCNELASHGFVVASLEHRDGSASMTLCLEEQLEPLIRDSDDLHVLTQQSHHNRCERLDQTSCCTSSCPSSPNREISCSCGVRPIPSRTSSYILHQTTSHTFDTDIGLEKSKIKRSATVIGGSSNETGSKRAEENNIKPDDSEMLKVNDNVQIKNNDCTKTTILNSEFDICDKTKLNPSTDLDVVDASDNNILTSENTNAKDKEDANLVENSYQSKLDLGLEGDSTKSDKTESRIPIDSEEVEKEKTTRVNFYFSDGQEEEEEELEKRKAWTGYSTIQPKRKQKKRSLRHNHSCRENWRPFQHVPVWDDFEYRNKQMYQRAEEISDVLDELININDGSHINNALGLAFQTTQFKNRLDLSRVAVIGHSFGAASSLATLKTDRRFKVGISMDGWLHPLDEKIYKETSQPTLFLNMEEFQWERNVNMMIKYQNAKPHVDRPMMTLMGGCHQSMTDFQFCLPKFLGRIVDVCGPLNPEESLATCVDTSLAFLFKHLDMPMEDKHKDILECRHPHLKKGTNVDLTIPDTGPVPP